MRFLITRLKLAHKLHNEYFDLHSMKNSYVRLLASAIRKYGLTKLNRQDIHTKNYFCIIFFKSGIIFFKWQVRKKTSPMRPWLIYPNNLLYEVCVLNLQGSRVFSFSAHIPFIHTQKKKEIL